MNTTDMTLMNVWQAHTQQRLFRRLLEAFSYPGRLLDATDSGTTARLAILATLLDGEVNLADPHGLITPEDRRRLMASAAAPEQARFVVADAARVPNFTPALGSLESPEFGATLLLEVEQLGAGSPLLLTGPGIASQKQLAVHGLHPDWIARRADWVSAYPLGVDIILCDAKHFAALPRTTQITQEAL
ncbi:MAG TPA: phosphonate C-P lyase system protein PhnH [Rugosibacter sp.]|nr:phosphonate C-P lyase system protein PhnH [Rugosibacter sp.]